jgi:hypothetical protein
MYKRKTITFELSEDQHKTIKIAAANKGISMSLLMHRAIIDYLKKLEKE